MLPYIKIERKGIEISWPWCDIVETHCLSTEQFKQYTGGRGMRHDVQHREAE